MISIEKILESFNYDPTEGILKWKIYRYSGSNYSKMECYPGKIINSKATSLYGERMTTSKICWALYYKKYPDYPIIDHKDGNTKNIKIKNLREATNSQNQMNKIIQSNNTSGIVGVFWYQSKKKWCARIIFENNKIHLGYFNNVENAIKARKNAEEEYFGEFSRKNSRCELDQVILSEQQLVKQTRFTKPF